MSHPYLLLRYRLDGVVTVVDAVNGETTLDTHVEAVKQAAVADRIVLTKTDLADAAQYERILARLRALNPAAPVLDSAKGEAVPKDFSEAGFTIRTKKFRTSESGLPPRLIPMRDHHHHHDVIGTTTTSVLSS